MKVKATSITDKTEKAKILEQNYFKNSLDKFYNATEYSLSGICILNENFNFIYLNKSAADNRGYERAYISTKNFFDFLSNKNKKAKAQIIKNIKAGKWQGELEILDKLKQKKILHLVIHPLPPQNNKILYLAIETDLTKPRATESKLAETKNEYQLFFDASSDIMVKISPKGLIEKINHKIQAYGYSEADFVNKNFKELTAIFTPKSLVIMAENFIFYSHKNKKNESYEVEARTKKGEPRILEISTIALNDVHKKNSGYLSILHDITERKIFEGKIMQAKQELENLNKNLDLKVQQNTIELRKAYDELKSLDTLKDEFLNISAHELKTPLTSIIGLSELIMMEKQGEITPLQKKSLTIVNDEANRLLNIIKKILGITRIEANKAIFDIQKTNICELLPKVIEPLKQLAEKQKVSIICRHPNQKILVNADPERTKEVVYNLIDNALKFSPIGAKIMVTGKIHDSDFIFSVKDQGPGIDPAKKDKLFQKFSQLDTGYARKQEGTGLGLYISKIIIENMKGKIWVKSGLGKGAEFIFSLPLSKYTSRTPKKH